MRGRVGDDTIYLWRTRGIAGCLKCDRVVIVFNIPESFSD